MSEQRLFRCAVYTRKSSEEGLEQDFNSLEAQREACEAYTRSQSHEGWKLIVERFDDGGYSGGNVDRPALARLMDLVREGKVDVIVIYKIDRLTRSLTDFARLAETFDKHGVSFVSVTQQFNTTTSMGRLMLNVLLSFAQFEREITGERIRDKIAASKKKGMWMGGPIPMGYDVNDRQLVVNEEHAKTIRRIFELYLEEGSVPALLERLDRERIRTAARTSAKGNVTGSRTFTRGHIYKVLSNPIYVGRVAHKGKTHQGQQPGIVDQKLWDAVQARLAYNTQGDRKRRERVEHEALLLVGRLFTQSGHRMIPTHATKGQRRYDYYVEQATERSTLEQSKVNANLPLAQQVTQSDDPFTGANRRVALRLPAAEVDKTVGDAVAQLLTHPAQLVEHLGDLSGEELAIATQTAQRKSPRATLSLERLCASVRSVVALKRCLEIEVDRDALRGLLGLPKSSADRATNGASTTINARVKSRRRGRQIVLAIGEATPADEMAVDRTLVTAIARAFDWFERLSSGAAESINDLALSDGFDAAYVSHLLPVALLAPLEVEAILEGREKAYSSGDQLIWHTRIPLAWSKADGAALR